MGTAPTSIQVLLRPTLGQSDEPSDLRGSLSPTSVYSTWQSQAVTHPIMKRARGCLTSVIEPTPMRGSGMNGRFGLVTQACTCSCP